MILEERERERERERCISWGLVLVEDKPSKEQDAISILDVLKKWQHHESLII
jgi:hypothetical protein